jgi:GT2 family glycosyltransferase
VAERPIATVVVPTHDRAPRLARALRALEAQVVDGPLEVVVVDDASSDGTAALLAAWTPASVDVSVRTLRLDRNGGPATARNLGWRAASSERICFTDDDCVARPDWVARLVAALDEADVVQGRTVPAPDEAANRGPFSHTMDVPFEDGHYATCNVAYRRATLERVGGFDEAFARPYGEDADLAWRAIGAGARTAFDGEAVVEHEVRPSSLRAHLRDLRRRDGLVHVLRKHPGLRARLPYHGFVRPTHLPLAVLVACGGAVAVAPSVVTALAAVVAAGWYAWVTRRERPAPRPRWRWIPTLPMAVVADLVEVAVLARASVRHRTLVL